MAEVIPFKGVLYNTQKVDANIVMAPPYDIVTPEFKDALYGKSPYNIIRIDFGKDEDGDSENENRYTRAAKFFGGWLKKGILINDSEPAFYCYEITYRINGQKKKLRGFLGAVRIEELGTGRIHPHEMTYSKPKSDRSNILRYCRANTSPIFSIYSSRKKRASSILSEAVKNKPFIEAKNGEGFVHRLWRISDKASINAVKEEMSDKDIFIADGHHRYETSLRFKNEMDKLEGARGKTLNTKPWDYVLMFLANIEDEGLTLLPTHRIVEVDSNININDSLKNHFDIQRTSSKGISGQQARQKMFEIMHKQTHCFGMFLTNADTYYTLSFNRSKMGIALPACLKNLDVTVLHKLIFEKLLKIEHYEYEMEPEAVVEKAKKGSFEAVFFLNPTKIEDVKKVALAGQRMPPKSTYFYPKLLTGMVIYKF
ncbi:MAG: DUF1015 domain-containing protein [Nitrospirae bacterium]|nr:DUF1015 domain-containing protein [Nitrospirota bacterium]